MLKFLLENLNENNREGACESKALLKCRDVGAVPAAVAAKLNRPRGSLGEVFVVVVVVVVVVGAVLSEFRV